MKTQLFVRDRGFYRLIITLALPVVLQNMITIGVNILDSMMLGALGEVPLSGASLANDFINLFQLFCLGLGGGSAVLTAQFWGRRDVESLRRAVSVMVRVALIGGTVFLLLSLLCPGALMRLYTPDEAVIASGSTYFRFSAPTYLLMGLFMPLTAVMRTVHQVKVPLFASIASFFVNLFCNWVFIFGNLGAPRMEAAGAALGTVIARAVETGIVVVYLLRFEKVIRLRPGNLLRFDRTLFRTFCKYSVPVMISDILLGLGNTAFSIIMGHISTPFVAAYSIIGPVMRLSTVFCQGLSNAASTITGNTMGTGDQERAYRQGVTLITLSAIIGALSSMALLVLCPIVLSAYPNLAGETHDIAQQLMYSMAIMTFFQVIGSALTKGVLRGGGDTRFLMVADVLFLWAVSIPLCALGGVVWGVSPFLVLSFFKLEHLLKTVWCLGRFRRKTWMRTIQVHA